MCELEQYQKDILTRIAQKKKQVESDCSAIESAIDFCNALITVDDNMFLPLFARCYKYFLKLIASTNYCAGIEVTVSYVSGKLKQKEKLVTGISVRQAALPKANDIACNATNFYIATDKGLYIYDKEWNNKNVLCVSTNVDNVHCNGEYFVIVCGSMLRVYYREELVRKTELIWTPSCVSINSQGDVMFAAGNPACGIIRVNGTIEKHIMPKSIFGWDDNIMPIDKHINYFGEDGNHYSLTMGKYTFNATTNTLIVVTKEGMVKWLLCEKDKLVQYYEIKVPVPKTTLINISCNDYGKVLYLTNSGIKSF